MKKLIVLTTFALSFYSFGQIVKPTPIATPAPINKELAQFIVEQKQFNAETRTQLQNVDSRQAKTEAGISRIENKLSQMEQRQIQMLELLQNQQDSSSDWSAIQGTSIKRKFFAPGVVALKNASFGKVLISSSQSFSTAQEVQTFCSQYNGMVPGSATVSSFAQTLGQSSSEFAYMLSQYTGISSNGAGATWANVGGSIQIVRMYSSAYGSSDFVITLCEI